MRLMKKSWELRGKFYMPNGRLVSRFSAPAIAQVAYERTRTDSNHVSREVLMKGVRTAGEIFRFFSKSAPKDSKVQ